MYSRISDRRSEILSQEYAGNGSLFFGSSANLAFILHFPKFSFMPPQIHYSASSYEAPLIAGFSCKIIRNFSTSPDFLVRSVSLKHYQRRLLPETRRGLRRWRTPLDNSHGTNSPRQLVRKIKCNTATAGFCNGF